MNKQPIFFMSGFPRAGTTLLMNILNQNPKLHGTPTSGLIGSVINLRDNWRSSDIYKSNTEEYVYPRIKGLLRGMMMGFYNEELINNITPIDKNRSWSGQLDLLDEIFGMKVKFIYPVRHVVDCCISIEKKNRQSTLTNHGDNGNWLNEQSTIGRAENFIKDDGVFGMPLLLLREIIYRGEESRLIIVPYDDLLTYPKEMLKGIYGRLEIDSFEHDFENIKQSIVEHDLMHGFAPHSLHKIKEGKLTKPKPRDMTIYKEDYMNQIEKNRFKDITEFINKYSVINKR